MHLFEQFFGGDDSQTNFVADEGLENERLLILPDIDRVFMEEQRSRIALLNYDTTILRY